MPLKRMNAKLKRAIFLYWGIVRLETRLRKTREELDQILDGMSPENLVEYVKRTTMEEK